MLNRRLLKDAAGLGAVSFAVAVGKKKASASVCPVSHSDDEWKRLLTADQFDILRRDGTEQPFSSALLHESRKGTFACAGCGQEQFSSNSKFESGKGWPSFWQPIDAYTVAFTRDYSLGLIRVAVQCSNCGGHLGHLFNDGPAPTGLRYCLNGAALKFHLAISALRLVS